MFESSLKLAAEISALYRQALPLLQRGSPAWRLARRTAARPIDYMRYAEFDAALAHVRLAPGQRVLDIASPQGLTLALARRHPEVNFTYINITAYELEPYAEVLAALGMRNVQLQQVDVRECPFDDASFDLAWSISVIEHVAPEQGGDVMALREIRRVLKPGGALLLTVPCKAQRNVVFVDGAIYERTGGERNFFAREYDLDQFREMCRAVAMQPSDVQMICEQPGLLAIDNLEWGEGKGRWWGERMIALRRYPERLLGKTLDGPAATRHLRVSPSPQGRLVNVFAVLRGSPAPSAGPGTAQPAGGS